MKIHLIRSKAALAAAAVLLITGLAAGCGHRSGSPTGSTPEERRADTTQRAAALPTVLTAANGTVTQADNDRTTATVSAPPQKTDATQSGRNRTASDTASWQHTTAASVARPTNRQTSSGTTRSSTAKTAAVTKAPTSATTAAATAKPTEKDSWRYPYDIDEITRYCRAKIEAAGKVWDETLTPDNASWNDPDDTGYYTDHPNSTDTLKNNIDEWIRYELSILDPSQNRIRIYFEPMKDYPGDYSIYFLNTGRR